MRIIITIIKSSRLCVVECWRNKYSGIVRYAATWGRYPWARKMGARKMGAPHVPNVFGIGD